MHFSASRLLTAISRTSLPAPISAVDQGSCKRDFRSTCRPQFRHHPHRYDQLWYECNNLPPPIELCSRRWSVAVPSGHISPEFIYHLFWVYVTFSLLVCFPMLMIWFNKPHDLTTFTPAWAFLIFPMMLVGVIAFNVLRVIPPEEPRAIGVLLVGYAFQGLGAVSGTSSSRMALISRNVGFFMTFFYICIYIIRWV